jgi:hypothetical protein
MRTSTYIGSQYFGTYPRWVKPFLVSLGAMFLVTAIFLLILIVKSSSQAAAAEAAKLPPPALFPAAPAAAPALAAAAPTPAVAAREPAQETAAAEDGESDTEAAPARPVPHRIAKANRRASHHVKKSRTAPKAGHTSRRSGTRDPLLDLLR